jgi:membrane associated rhomboid family serine protease
MLPIKDTVQSRSFPLVNWLLIGLNVVAFLMELRAGRNIEELVYVLGVIPSSFLEQPDAHEYMTLLTSMFLHGGWFHLFSNMLALYIFGDNVEDRMGPVRYLLFYLLCGVAAGLVHIHFNPHSTVPTIGASGAIAGVLGAYLMLFPAARVITMVPVFFMPYFIELPAVVYLGVWFLSQLLNGTLAIVAAQPTMGGVAWWARAGGFVAGAVLVWLFAVMTPTAPPRRRVAYADEYYPW